MQLLCFRQRNYRNLKSPELCLEEGPLVVVGANAAGKTNLLEALYSITGGDTRVPSAVRISSGAASAELFVEAETTLGPVRFEQRLSSSGRVIRINEASASQRELTEYPGSVWIRPEDTALVKGGPEERRRFLDALIQRFSGRYTKLLTAYERVLRQRNALLRHEPQGMGAWDRRLVQYGGEIIAFRRRVFGRLAPLAARGYQSLAPGRLELELIETTGPEDFQQALDDHFEEALARGFTPIGPHRDDLMLKLNGLAAPRFASRGEARSIALALRLAEHRLAWNHHDEPPILLIDDFSAELDPARQNALLSYAYGLPQVILSGTGLPKDMGRTLYIEDGVWHA